MAQLFGRILVIVFLCSVMIACEKEDLSITPTTEDVSVDYKTIELEVMKLVNSHRDKLGLSTLFKLNLVSKEAETHSVYMLESGVISHDNFDERTRNLIEYTEALSVGENVSYGYQTAEKVFESWLNSAGHRRVIEGKSYTDFGISAKQNSRGSYYITQIFIERD